MTPEDLMPEPWGIAVVHKPKRLTPDDVAAVPALIRRAGERAAWRFLEFFAANIRNKNTRAAYARAVRLFCEWLDERGLRELERVNPVLVAAYIEPHGCRACPVAAAAACRHTEPRSRGFRKRS